MRCRLLMLLLPLVSAVAYPASAQVFVGPNLEWSYASYPDPNSDASGGVLSVGGFDLSPGLRLGYLLPGGALTAYLDAGIQFEHYSPKNYTNVMMQPTLAYAFMTDRTTNPYVAISAGWHHYSNRGVSPFTRPIIGGVAGVRRRVAGGHGFIRGEFRYDHFTTTDTKGWLFPENVVGLRLGCDLLFSQ